MDLKPISPDFISPPGRQPILTNPATKGRLTVVEMVYHQQFGEQPTCIETRYSKLLESSDQAYVRKYVIGEQWKPLDHGWVREETSLVVIKNELPLSLINPTPEERQETSRRVVEIRLGEVLPVKNDSNDLLISPGESLRMCPSRLSSVYVRCKCGETRVTVAVFPR